MNRVRVRDYGVLLRGSRLLRPVVSVDAPCRLHWRAAAAFVALSGAVKLALGLELKAASGWRPHRWRSRREYEDYLLRNYGSVAEGKRWLAFDSPHETGLAVDLGVGGLWPARRTIEQQRGQPLHRWLLGHASEHGWRPYDAEPWHWELLVDPAEFRAEETTGALEPAPEGPNMCAVSSEEEQDDVQPCEADDICEMDPDDP
jgi:D-alanyl-D-alanine dipeptidase